MDKKQNITVKFFSHLKDKAGVNVVDMEIAAETTIAELKQQLIARYPALETHLTNILILIDSKIAIDEDVIPAGCTVSFMTPIGGG
jgi:molybdopterin converting factor small subunit